MLYRASNLYADAARQNYLQRRCCPGLFPGELFRQDVPGAPVSPGFETRECKVCHRASVPVIAVSRNHYFYAWCLVPQVRPSFGLTWVSVRIVASEYPADQREPLP